MASRSTRCAVWWCALATGGALSMAAALATTSGCSRSSSPTPMHEPAIGAPMLPIVDDGAHDAIGEPVAVVELFTSEGCSSCPKADALLTELVTEERAQQKNVLFLSFHVDYWDGLGFPDPWSSADYSARQRAYARMFQQSGVYTPQAVISGTDEVLGSDGSGVRTRIDAALAKPSRASIAVTLGADASNGSIDVAYAIRGDVAGLVIHAAVVERDLVDTPTAGENRGTVLHHDDVVRAFETVRAAEKGSLVIAVPKSVKRDHASVVVYLQRESDLAILSATSRDL